MSSEQAPEPASETPSIEATPVAKKYSAWIDTAIDQLFKVGTSWARQGLTMGKVALQASAKTLGETAESLEALAQKLELAKKA